MTRYMDSQLILINNSIGDDMQKDKLEAAKVLLDELRTKCTDCKWDISLKMVDAVALIVEAIEEEDKR